MKILLVNDDGIKGKGLIELAKKLNKSHDIVVIAPTAECSGKSHSITFNGALNYNHIVDFGDNILAYSVDGTPVDCVKFGLDVICQDNMPDLILSGINNELNIGTDVLYSGTVNAAIEGAIMEIPSIAISLASKDDFEYACEFIDKNLKSLAEMIESYETILNINIPSPKVEDIKGIKTTKVGVMRYSDRYELRNNDKESGYYLMGEPIAVPENPENCDVEWSKKGYITITPLKILYTGNIIEKDLKL